MPGAVVVVGRGDTVLYEKAFGQRAVAPLAERMTLDTVFDLASLTKVVATTTAVMQLVEHGKLRLTDPVASWVPGFGRYGKGGITIRHLLTHVSGLRPDVDLGDPWQGYEAAIELAKDEVPQSRPGERFVYSDINFFLLGHIVGRVSGEPLERFTLRHVFEPLAMTDTGFLPTVERIGRIAPTERCRFLDAWPCQAAGEEPLRGVVHDPTARRMGGVAGHAGLFSTARDLTRFVRMLLGGGALGARRVLAPLTVARMIAPATPAGMPAARALGWDVDTSFSANRGELLPIGSFGHTGFTGTSIWVDPRTRLFVIFLSSRLHPDGHGDVAAIRARVATVAASAIVDLTLAEVTPARMTGADFGASADPARPVEGVPTTRVLAGIDVLARDGFALLTGRKVGLVTNHTGRSTGGTSTIDLLHRAPGVSLVALFSPEHGIRGVLDEDVPSSRDEATGLLIHSLYGATRRPTAAMLAGLDTLVIDLQDVGVRFYTYPATLGYVLEEAAKAKIKVVVLDRPNPINGWQIEGPLPDDAVHRLQRLPADADPARPHAGRAGAAFQRRARPRRRSHGGARGRLAPRPVVRSHRPVVGQSVAEHAQPEPGHAVSRHRRHRVRQYLRRPRHRPALRADRRAVDRRPQTGGGPQRAGPARHPLLPGAVHAGLERPCRPGVPGRVPGRHQSRGAATGAPGARDRLGAVETARRRLRPP